MIYLGILALLSLLVVVHELGHLAAAKLAGIPVAGFSVGFGPKLWTRRWGQVEYSLRALPLGGFVMPAVTDEQEFRPLPWESGWSSFSAARSPISSPPFLSSPSSMELRVAGRSTNS